MEVDVIIPTYNQSYPLKLTLQGFRKQITEAKIHLIIVDDGSTQPIGKVLEQFGDLNITYVRQENAGRSSARNAATKYLKGKYIILNDSDRIPHSVYVASHLETIRESIDVISIGRTKELFFSEPTENEEKIMGVVKDDSGIARESLYSRVIDNLFDEYGNTKSKIPWISTLSCNMALSRNSYESVGGFDDNFKSWGFEHFELGYRLFNRGMKFVRQRKSINYHIAHSRPNNFYKSSIEDSHRYFYNKYSTLEVKLLKPFILGEISLQDYELQVAESVEWSISISKPIFNKILNGV